MKIDLLKKLCQKWLSIPDKKMFYSGDPYYRPIQRLALFSTMLIVKLPCCKV